MICVDCAGSCTCHTAMPPCEFCVTHNICEACGRVSCKIDSESQLCPECYEITLKEGKIC